VEIRDEKKAQEVGDAGEVRAKLRGLVFVGARGGAGEKKKEHAVLARSASNRKEVALPVEFGHAGGNRPARNLDCLCFVDGFMSTSTQIVLKPFPVKTALLIDADEPTRTFLANALDPGEWSIRHAANNQSALELAQVARFDLILTSAKSSGKEDVELLRKLRAARPHTRLIILTDESAPSYVIDSMREHAFSYFSKPFSLDALAEMVHLASEQPCWDDGIEVVSGTPEWIRLNVRCDQPTADRLIQFLHEIADLPEGESNKVAVAFREILLNAMEHGGKFRPDQYVQISYVRAKHMVLCRIKDPGEGFTLDEIQHAAVANPPDDPIRHAAYRQERGMRPGGYGILLAQKLVDELIYNEEGNEVLLVKYLENGELKH
jgi:anti-sigma regulatory factor (Ser/Thr protein kinase)/ActR/RegA family two-component response regulator